MSKVKQHQFRFRGDGYPREESLTVYWELEHDWITDDYLPSEISAEELFHMWAKEMMEKHPDGLVPITWYVTSRAGSVCEGLPFQHEPPLSEDFLTYFTWPEDLNTGEPIRWSDLPVRDKLWNRTHSDKGGFIQSYTGWKPSIYQPYLYLPALLEVVVKKEKESTIDKEA